MRIRTQRTIPVTHAPVVRSRLRPLSAIAVRVVFSAAVGVALCLRTASAADRSSPLPVGRPTFVSPHAAPIVLHGGQVFVANTPSDTVDVVATSTLRIVARVSVGVDPVSLAVRPDGEELWVSNHVSDSVSVIDLVTTSPTYLQVVATVQEFDDKTRATRFDEPVGIAFAGNDKAYVALSSENEIAVVDVPSRLVTRRLAITAQDPRAIVVRGDRLYVLPFESNNKTQLSGGTGKLDGELVTFNAWEHSIANNNVLSLGHVLDIVKHPRVPDRDLYVFDTKTDAMVHVVDTLGTLLYGLAVDSKGRAFIAQADARNDANGRSGTKKHGLAELENRAFLNRITRVEFKDGEAQPPRFFDLEPLPPEQPAVGKAVATPFAIEVTRDDATLFVSAAGSDKLVTIDAASGEVVGEVGVGAVPRGIALEYEAGDAPSRAWVLNAVANTVSVVDVAKRSTLRLEATVELEDPTHPVVKRGRIAFNTAAASTTGTFSCASCHPDGHTDQLLWVLQTPIVTGGNQIMPRSTMPIRGLRDTAPYHWDGIPGDPYGGNNSANIHGSDAPNSNVDDATSTTRHLIDGGLASTMMQVEDKSLNDEGKPGALSAAERDAMATFLLSVPYPPAQKRAYTNVLSEGAKAGFKLFHIDGDLDGKPRPNVCGDCHRMPFWVSTNTPGTGMDAPTWRGAYDRFLILPQGRLNIIDFDFYRRVAEEGIPERKMWQFSWGGRRRFDPIWNMVLEGSTGYSGAFARQVTLSSATSDQRLTGDLLNALEVAAGEGGIVLEVDGAFIDESTATTVSLQYDATFDGGAYVEKGGERRWFERATLISLARHGKFVGTFSGRHGGKSDVEHPQPGIWTVGPIEKQRGRQEFPVLHREQRTMTVSGRHLDDGAHVLVNGRRVRGSVARGKAETFVIELAELPPRGMHLLQLQNRDGLFTNDFIFHVTEDAQAAALLNREIEQAHVDSREALAKAAAEADLSEVKRLLRRGARINARRPEGGATALSEAALRGHTDVVEYLLERGADVNATNRDGNTPLHVAAFLCRTDIVELLLKSGASITRKNRRGETPPDVVAGPWTDDLAGFYRGLDSGLGLQLDLDEVRRKRPQTLGLLRGTVRRF